MKGPDEEDYDDDRDIEEYCADAYYNGADAHRDGYDSAEEGDPSARRDDYW